MWKKKKRQDSPVGYSQSVQCKSQHTNPFYRVQATGSEWENRLFDRIRESVPMIDAGIHKIIRLVGGFEIVCSDSQSQQEIEEFCKNVQVGATSMGLSRFLYCYLDNLLTYGNAAGEIVPNKDGEGIGALYNVPLQNISVKQGENPLEIQFFARRENGEELPIAHPERILFTAFQPKAGQIKGRSLLSGLEEVSSILLSIYRATGQNFERMGNLRYAVTYNPNGEIDGGYAREIAQDLATQWADTMQSGEQIKDFVAVGDVQIRVIGADNQIIDTQIPVRQMLEQIVAKLGLPPFILGLSWSITERMSQQQAEILASELESYRELLNSVILRICRFHLRSMGLDSRLKICWKNVSITDEVERARAKLLEQQAQQLKEKPTE